MDISPAGFLRAFDLIGICVFAASGATLAVRARMDLFGVVVLAIVTAISGGIMRDVLIGVSPPVSIADWRPMALAIAVGGIGFVFPHLTERLRHPVQLLDAAGLGVFAATGARAALDHGLAPPMAAMLGMLSAIGGGMVRDVLMARIPVVLRAEIYALAALLGATTVVVGDELALPPEVTMLAGAAVCLFLRTMAIYRGWRLPVSTRHGSSTLE